MRRRITPFRLALAGLATSLALSACGTSELTAASSCRDLLNAPASAQHEAIDRLSAQYRKPDFATPLGEPEVPYYCSANPGATLGAFFARAGG
jgi:hypothetical protein